MRDEDEGRGGGGGRGRRMREEDEGGGRRRRRRGGRGWEGEVGSKACVLSAKVATTCVSRRREERGWHVDWKFTVTQNTHLCRGQARTSVHELKGYGLRLLTSSMYEDIYDI